jgi:hypothetical protein
LKMAIYSGFSHEKWFFSIVMLNYKRVLFQLRLRPKNAGPTIQNKGPIKVR